MTEPCADDVARLRRAMASMAATFERIAADLDARAGERCPYRSARDLCTFDSGCRNQRRGERGGLAVEAAGSVACGGDGQLCWAPPRNSLELGAGGLEPVQ